MPYSEVNFDGLVGPTHNFAGLSSGNLASIASRGTTSNPRDAALQDLAKMRRLMELGLSQGVLPPHERPHIPTLRRLGFVGTDPEVVESAWKVNPVLLANASSASAMWTANAATISPSRDTKDGRIHITPANLGAKFHRSLEPKSTSRILRTIFADPHHFAHHQPLPYGGQFGDEGAANHNRLCPSHGEIGVEVFVYGRSTFEDEANGSSRRFEPRQSREASESIIRLHQLDLSRTLLVQQSSKAVDAGAFHNDVVAVANGPVMFAHEYAFQEGAAAWDNIRHNCPFDVTLIQVPESEIPLAEAIKTYIFNGQLVTLPDGNMALVLPKEVSENPRTMDYVNGIVGKGGQISTVFFTDLGESMRNGGGPACLRLRVVLNEEEKAALRGAVILDNAQLSRLEDWVKRNYRDRLCASDIGDPLLLDETRLALDELSNVLCLGSIYDFQSAS